MQDRTLTNLQRKLDRWELEHLRALVSQQADRIEHLEQDVDALQRNAEFWERHAHDLMCDLQDSGEQIGITPEGDAGIISRLAHLDAFEESESVHLRRELLALIDDWKTIARNGFASAKTQDTDDGRRFVDYGAMCYANCVISLSKALGIKIEAGATKDDPFGVLSEPSPESDQTAVHI